MREEQYADTPPWMRSKLGVEHPLPPLEYRKAVSYTLHAACDCTAFVVLADGVPVGMLPLGAIVARPEMSHVRARDEGAP